MLKNRLLRITSIFAVFYWSFSWWGYKFFFFLTTRPNLSRSVLAHICTVACAWVYFLHIPIQIVLCWKRGIVFIVKKLFINTICVIFISLYAFLVSIFEENRWALVSKFFIGSNAYSLDYLRYLIKVVPTGQGADIVLCFLMALVSGHMVCSKMAECTNKEFKKMLGIWFIIILINEVIVQRLLFYRNGSLLDILNNMAGVLVSLLLSIRWSSRMLTYEVIGSVSRGAAS